MVIATYGRVSKLEQARDTDALVRQKWQLERATTGLEEVISFVDIQTGKRDDRPDFLRLLAAIEPPLFYHQFGALQPYYNLKHQWK